MLSRKLISLALCAVMLLSCVMVATNAEARPRTNWSNPALIVGGDSQDARESVIAMNGAGDAAVAWTDYGGAVHVIRAITYADGAWGPAVMLSSGIGNAGDPAVAVDDDGNAVVVYWHFNGYIYQIIAVALHGGAWGSEHLISDNLYNMPAPKVAMNGAGTAVAVWEADHGTGPLTEAAVFQGGAWSTALVISDGVAATTSSDVAIDDDGEATAVWAQGDTDLAVYAARYDGTQWEGPLQLSVIGVACQTPSVSMNDAGVTVAVWRQQEGETDTIVGFVYFNGIWDMKMLLSSLDQYASSGPEVIVNNDGAMCAVWTSSDGESDPSLAMYYRSGEGRLTTLPSSDRTAQNPAVAMNAYGEVMTAWYDSGTDYSYIQSERFANGGWAAAGPIDGMMDATDLDMGMSDDGRAVAVWCEQTSENSYLYFSVYTPDDQPAVSITSPDQDSFNSTSSVTVEWTGTNVDHYTLSVNGADPLNLAQDTSAALSALADGAYNVNITAYNARGVSAYADVDFMVDTAAPSLNIIIPAIGAWYNSSAMNVTWTVSDEGSGLANVSVSMDGGAWADVLTDYQVFNSLADGQHNISVRAYDLAGNIRTSYKLFNIDTQLPVLDITDPDDDAMVNRTSVELRWEAASLSDIGRYWLSIDGSEFVNVGTNTSWALSDLAEGDHTVTLKARDFAGNYNTTSIGFTVDSVAPVIEFTSPVDGSHTNANDIVVEWTVTESGSGLDKVEVSIDGGEWAANDAGRYDLEDLADGAHNVAVRAYDNAGNLAEGTVDLIVDTVAPTSSASPTGEDAAISSAITVTFSEAMNTSSVVITVEGFDSLEGTVSWNGNVATFTPSAPMPYGRGYTVNVTGEDLAGNAMDQGYSTFTTMKDEGVLSGDIRDTSGQPVANATVTLSNGMTTTTDVAGHFVFTGVPSGSYTMNVTKDGLRTISQTVSVVAGQSTALESLSMASAVASPGGDGTWVLGIVGVVIVAMLGIGFIVYRYKKK